MGKQNKNRLGRFAHFQAYSDILRDNHAYSGTIQAYSGPCVTLAYSKPSHTQNPYMFRTRGILRALAYLEPRYFQNPGIFRTTGEIFIPWYIHNTVKHLRWSVFRN